MSPHLAFFNTPHEVPSPNGIFPAAGCSILGGGCGRASMVLGETRS